MEPQAIAGGDLRNVLRIARNAHNVANEAREEVTEVNRAVKKVVDDAAGRDEQLTAIQEDLTQGRDRFEKMEGAVTKLGASFDEHKQAVEDGLIKPLGEFPKFVDEVSAALSLTRRLIKVVAVIASVAAYTYSAWELFVK